MTRLFSCLVVLYSMGGIDFICSTQFTQIIASSTTRQQSMWLYSPLISQLLHIFNTQLVERHYQSYVNPHSSAVIFLVDSESIHKCCPHRYLSHFQCRQCHSHHTQRFCRGPFALLQHLGKTQGWH